MGLEPNVPRVVWILPSIVIFFGIFLSLYLFIKNYFHVEMVTTDPIEGFQHSDRFGSSELNRSESPMSSNSFDLQDSDSDNDPFFIEGKIRRNQRLASALRSHGLQSHQIDPVIGSMSEVFDFRRSKPGDRYEVRLDSSGGIVEFTYRCSTEEVYHSRRDGQHYFNEVVVFSTNLIHVFLRSRRYPDHAAVFVSRASANVGMVLMKSRAALGPVENAV